jgi:hypothetical protein
VPNDEIAALRSEGVPQVRQRLQLKSNIKQEDEPKRQRYASVWTAYRARGGPVFGKLK